MIEQCDAKISSLTTYHLPPHPSTYLPPLPASLLRANNAIKMAKITYNGLVYDGDVVDGKPNGRGKMIYLGGDVYEGEWKNGCLNGQGTYNWNDGRSYKGEWKDGKRHGKGTFKRSDGSMEYDGEWRNHWRNGAGTFNYSNGDVYIGTFRSNKPNGKGVMTYADKSVYDGEWREGKRADGRSYEGKWEGGSMHGKGKGTLKRSDGSVEYVGGNNCWQNGAGTSNYSNGDVYIGEFRSNKPHGKQARVYQKHGRGVMTYADKSVYDGEWRGDKRHGEGSLILTNGDIIKGEWIEGNNRTHSLLTSRNSNRAANPQDTNESGNQPAAMRTRLQELQLTNAKLQMKNEELQNQVVAKDKLIREKVEEVTKKDEELVSAKTVLQHHVVAKDKVIAEKDEAIEKMQGNAVVKDKVIAEKDEVVAKVQSIVVEKDRVIAEKDKVIVKKDEELASVKSKFQYQVEEKDDELAEKDDELAEKDKEIFSLKAKLKKIGQMVIESDDESSDADGQDEGIEVDRPAKRRRTENGLSGNGLTNRATRNRARRVQVKHENIKAGKIKCPDPQCNNIILHDGGCKRLTCTKHQPHYLYFCAHCKMIGEHGSEIIQCDCPNRNTQADRDLAQDMRNQRSRANPEVLE
eukprot:scaffold16385_cov73-Skeletonema_dohrnii-CCMP3373.AAC.2